MQEILFKNKLTIDNLGEPHWVITRIEKILPYTKNDQLFASTMLDGTFSLDPTGNWDILDAREIIFGNEDAYSMNLDFSDELSKVFLTIEHKYRDVNFTYHLPWKFKEDPNFALIGSKGRKIILANRYGDILLTDVSEYAIK